MSTARTVLLMTLRSDKSLPVADLSKRDSCAAETHSVMISTTPAVNAPSNKVRTDSMEPPTFQRIWYSSSNTRGKTPVTHSITANHAIQESVRSSKRTMGVAPKAACKTLTPNRIKAKDTHTGTKIANKAIGWSSVMRARAAKVKGHEHRVSHETIYNCIYAQPVGELNRDLIKALKAKVISLPLGSLCCGIPFIVELVALLIAFGN